MAIAAGTVTLADYALMSNSPLVQAVSYSLIEAEHVLQDMPLQTNASLLVNGARFEGNLPSVNWSPLNAEGVTTKGTPTPYQEQAYILRNYIDVDKFIVQDKNAIVDPRAVQVEAYMKSFAYDFNYKFFKNDHVTGDSNSFTGLRYRIDNGGTFGVRPENKIDGGGVDLSTAATQATANQFITLLDQLLWSVDSPQGSNVVIYGNEVFQRRFTAAIRLMGTSGGFSIMQDQFGRTIGMYKGAILRDPGYKQDQATRIITTTETSTGLADTGGTYTSVYAVNYSVNHFSGWQFSDLNVQDLGLIYNGVIYRTLIDWAIGLNSASTRSIARLYDIKLS
jgi:hypothetical protein